MSSVLLYLTMAIQAAGIFLVALGYKARFGALLLIAGVAARSGVSASLRADRLPREPDRRILPWLAAFVYVRLWCWTTVGRQVSQPQTDDSG